jgi:hypothetical protein
LGDRAERDLDRDIGNHTPEASGGIVRHNRIEIEIRAHTGFSPGRAEEQNSSEIGARQVVDHDNIERSLKLSVGR